MRLETERLILRDIRSEDCSAIAAMFAEPSAAPYILRRQRMQDRVLRGMQAKARYADSRAMAYRARADFAVELKQSRELLGFCGAGFAFGWTATAIIGWHYSHAFAGNGFATEAAGAVIDYCIKSRGIDRFVCDCFASNVASRRIMEKLGMTLAKPEWLYSWLLSMEYSESAPIVRYKTRAKRVRL